MPPDDDDELEPPVVVVAVHVPLVAPGARLQRPPEQQSALVVHALFTAMHAVAAQTNAG